MKKYVNNLKDDLSKVLKENEEIKLSNESLREQSNEKNSEIDALKKEKDNVTSEKEDLTKQIIELRKIMSKQAGIIEEQNEKLKGLNQIMSEFPNKDVIWTLEKAKVRLLESGAKVISDTTNIVQGSKIIKEGLGEIYNGYLDTKPIVIKQFKNLSPDSLKHVVHEIIFPLQFQSPRLLSVFAVYIDEVRNDLWTISNRLKGNLHSLLETKLNNEEKLKISLQVIQGIEHLHNQNPPVIHRGIKPENILYDDKKEVYISDFGLCKACKEFIDPIRSFLFALSLYAAPEVFRSKMNYSTAFDIWSFGAILYHLFYEQKPWTGMNAIEALTNNFVFPVNDNPNVPKEITSLIKMCVNNETALRPIATFVRKYIEQYIK